MRSPAAMCSCCASKLSCMRLVTGSSCSGWMGQCMSMKANELLATSVWNFSVTRLPCHEATTFEAVALKLEARRCDRSATPDRVQVPYRYRSPHLPCCGWRQADPALPGCFRRVTHCCVAPARLQSPMTGRRAAAARQPCASSASLPVEAPKPQHTCRAPRRIQLCLPHACQRNAPQWSTVSPHELCPRALQHRLRASVLT